MSLCITALTHNIFIWSKWSLVPSFQYEVIYNYSVCPVQVFDAPHLEKEPFEKRMKAITDQFDKVK